MNILNKQIDSIYDRQKNLYSKYPHYSQQNAESKKVCEQEKITATSGKDVLGITKGDKENSYIVHFSDSAMVSRAVARGYVTVNGKEVELTEDTKQQLLKTDKEASAAREKAYQDWLIVSRQLYFTINLEEIFYFNDKKYRIYAVFGVSQTPKSVQDNERLTIKSQV